jgi:dihydrofolate reductase
MITLIAAIDLGGGIGNAGTIPWRAPEDMKRFKALTMGHPIVMGRKTYASIGKLPWGASTSLMNGPLINSCRRADARDGFHPGEAAPARQRVSSSRSSTAPYRRRTDIPASRSSVSNRVLVP